MKLLVHCWLAEAVSPELTKPAKNLQNVEFQSSPQIPDLSPGIISTRC